MLFVFIFGLIFWGALIWALFNAAGCSTSAPC
jgi:hypothetical protein